MRSVLLATARLGLLATALLGAAVDTAGQSHEPPARPVPVAQPAAADAHGGVTVPSSAGTAARPRPLVSRITAAPTATSTVAAEGAGTAGHVATAASPAGAKPRPVVSGAAGPGPIPSAEHAASAAQAAGHAAPAAAAARPPAAKGPARLATVHGRLTAALAAGREQQHGAPPAADPQAASGSHARASRPAPARYAVAWPKPRWRVVWPDVERLVVAWPE